jgi:hypothetical protein
MTYTGCSCAGQSERPKRTGRMQSRCVSPSHGVAYLVLAAPLSIVGQVTTSAADAGRAGQGVKALQTWRTRRIASLPLN